jgi:hypothetical protein
MATPRHPSLYQINTRVWLTALARSLGRRATLDDIPDAELDRLADRKFIVHARRWMIARLRPHGTRAGPALIVSASVVGMAWGRPFHPDWPASSASGAALH